MLLNLSVELPNPPCLLHSRLHSARFATSGPGDTGCLPADETCSLCRLTVQPCRWHLSPVAASGRALTSGTSVFPSPAQPQTNSTRNSIVTSPKGNVPSSALVYTSVSVCPSNTLWTCGMCGMREWEREPRVAFGCRPKGWKNAPAIRGNVLSRDPAKRLIEKINNTLCIKFGARAWLVKCKEGRTWEGRCFVVAEFWSIFFIYARKYI